MSIAQSVAGSVASSVASSVAGSGGGGTTTPIAYDYLITNDSEWSTVFSNDSATLSGKVIAVRAGTYTAKTLTGLNPSLTTRIVAEVSANLPVINGLTITSSSRLWLEFLNLVNTNWSSTAQLTGAVYYTGATSDITIKNSRIEARYRGTIAGADFDATTSDYPEYACILPVFDAGGVVTSLTVLNDYVGDLMANGTYSLVFNDYSVVFSVAPVATMTVLDGYITGTTLTSGGASNGTPTTGIGIRSALVTWAGQQKMGSYLGSGIRTAGDLALSGTLVVEDCHFELCNHGFKSGLTACDGVTVKGCTFNKTYQDHIALGSGVPLTVTDNLAANPFSAPGDPGDAHSDYFQILGGAFDWAGIVTERNILICGTSRGTVQGIFLQDTTTGHNLIKTRVVGNAVINYGTGVAFSIRNPKNAFIYANLVCRFDPTDPANTTIDNLLIDGSSIAHANVVGNNISENISVSSSPNVDTTTFPNAILGLNGALIPYSDIFTNPTAARTTVAQIVAAYTPKGAYAGMGPFGNVNYIDHVNRTTDLTLEPSFITFTSLNSQATSTLVTSEWSCVLGGPVTAQAITISGGEYRIADDDSGTGASSWTSSAGTVDRGKFVQVRHTTSASGSTDTTTTLTFRGTYAYTFTSTTASVLTFNSVDNQTTAYSRVDLSSFTGETGIRKIAMAVRFAADSNVAGANIFSDAPASSCKLWTPTTSAYRLQLFTSIRASLRPTLIPGTSPRTHFITLDFTNTTAGQGCVWATDIEEVLLNNSAGSGGTFDTRSTAGSGTDYGSFSPALVGSGGLLGGTGHLGVFGESDGGGTKFDGKVEFLWMDWGGAGYSLPDITHSAIRNKWLADLIGSNGEGPTGSTPKLFYAGNAAGWNAGLANLGSLTATLTKQAGTYA